MDIVEAIKKRKSIRGFKPDPVEQGILREILETASRAPSAKNTQPWEFYVFSGEVLQRIRERNVANLHNAVAPEPEHVVFGWSSDSVYRDRQVALAKQLFRLMDIPREDKAKRAAWMENGFRYFDAPAAIVVVVDRSLTEAGPLIDVGIATQSICLAALTHGLGTCVEDQGVLYPKVLREELGIPDSKRIMIAIAIGYPDWDFPANAVESDREPVDDTTTWLGFE